MAFGRRDLLKWLIGAPAVVGAAEIERRAQALFASVPEKVEILKADRLTGGESISAVPSVVNDHAERIDELTAEIEAIRTHLVI